MKNCRHCSSPTLLSDTMFAAVLDPPVKVTSNLAATGGVGERVGDKSRSYKFF